ncbi:MAG: DUF4160 domain-containing protein [Nitrospira sp.]|nr:DUF4160 domain-containing protein [Nitrospira sp.]
MKSAGRTKNRALSLLLFFFFAGDREAPPHVHVEHDDHIAKFWLAPVRLQESGGFSRSELNRVQQLVHTNQHQLREVWNEYFGR